MANRDNPRGLVPLIIRDSIIRKFFIASGETVGLYSPVAEDASGNIVHATAGATNVILGSIVGVYTAAGVPVAPPTVTTTSATSHFVLVCIATDTQLFSIQADDGGTAITSAAKGARLILLGTGVNSTTGISTVEADQSDIGVDATYQLSIVDLLNRIDFEGGNDWGANCDLEVLVNLPQQYRAATAGI